jgi:probable F420-dependent oxidoreductase
VHVGFLSLNTVDAVQADELAMALEERGYESLWIGEHPHLPVGARHPVRGDVAEPFRRMMDPFLSLLAAALVTRTLVVATGVALVLERSLLAQAKQIATLDQLAGGRVICGVGVGWSAEELGNASTIPWNRRFDALAEYIQALRILWTDDEADFDGEFFHFGKVWSYPKPSRLGGPILAIGGSSPPAVRLAATLGDAWCPLMPPIGDIATKLHDFRAACEETGRDPGSVPVTFVAARDDPRYLASAQESGVHRVVLGIEPGSWNRDGILPYLDGCARYVTDFA